MVTGKRTGFKLATNRTERRANRHGHRPIVEHYLAMAARGAFDHAPGEDQGTPTIS
jgi:hypothetical protein